VPDLIGWLATSIFAISYFMRNPASMRWVQALAAVCWIIYGVVLHATPVIVANVIVVTLAALTALRTVQKTPSQQP
jgi:uncharacterized protein with PQ loop repeat